MYGACADSISLYADTMPMFGSRIALIAILSWPSRPAKPCARFAHDSAPVVLAEAFVHFTENMRDALFSLQQPGDNEIERVALAANGLAARYAVCCHELLRAGSLSAKLVHAIGAHGQTVRHRPEKGYTVQIQNAALLAELTHIDVIADFRGRQRQRHHRR